MAWTEGSVDGCKLGETEALTAGLGVVAHPSKQAPVPIQHTQNAQCPESGKTVIILYLFMQRFTVLTDYTFRIYHAQLQVPSKNAQFC